MVISKSFWIRKCLTFQAFIRELGAIASIPDPFLQNHRIDPEPLPGLIGDRGMKESVRYIRAAKLSFPYIDARIFFRDELVESLGLVHRREEIQECWKRVCNRNR